MRFILFLLSVLILPLYSLAQTGTLQVRVLDESNSEPIIGATVSLMKKGTSTPVFGKQSNEQGLAKLEAVAVGNYDLKISFLGFLDFIKTDVNIAHNKTVDIGDVLLMESGQQINEVVVQGKVPEMQLGIDKKIFDVSQSLVSVGGTASDLLGNVPTLQVDQDGSISLRGSSSVRILIDGKESAMAGSDISKLLQSLPADIVSKVEIITNPSAKYDAEGQSGIINIILKKNVRTGLNGSVNAAVGSYDNYNAGVTLNYRDNKFNYFGSYNYRNGRNVGESYSRSVQLINGQETNLSQITETDVESNRKGINNSVRLGVDYYADDKTTLSLGGNLSVRGNKRGEDLLYSYYNLPAFGNKSPRISRQEEDDFGYDLTFDFKRTLKREGEELTANVTYGNDSEDGINSYYQTFDNNRPRRERYNNTSEAGQNWNLQLDYVLPLGENHKFEAGYRGILRASDEHQHSDTLNFDNSLVPDYRVSNDFEMRSGVHALYANYQRMLTSRIGMQIGLRAEDAYLNSTIIGFDPNMPVSNRNVEGKLDYLRLYPSAFLTYDVNEEGDKVQLNYSRRVQRPRGWQVNPFVDVSDEVNFRQGNPNLMPEDIHAFEMSFAKFYQKWNFVSSVYYRKVNDMSQPFQYDESDPTAAIYLNGNNNATFMRWENVGSRQNAGVELISKVNFFNWWDATANVNIFYMKVNPNAAFQVRETNDFSWNTNLTTNFKVRPTTSVQIRGDYRAGMKTLQGRMNAMHGIDVALRQDVLKGKGSLMFNVRDVFDKRGFGGENYLTTRYSNFQHRWSKRTFNLSFSYRFGMQDLGKNKKGDEDMPGDFNEGGY